MCCIHNKSLDIDLITVTDYLLMHKNNFFNYSLIFSLKNNETLPLPIARADIETK